MRSPFILLVSLLVGPVLLVPAGAVPLDEIEENAVVSGSNSPVGGAVTPGSQTPAQPAAEGGYVVGGEAVIGGNLNGRRARFRRSPNGEVFSLLSKDTKLVILGLDGKWVQVRANGKVGWVARSLVIPTGGKESLEPDPDEEQEPVTPPAEPDPTPEPSKPLPGNLDSGTLADQPPSANADNFFEIQGSVGEGGDNEPDSVLRIQRRLVDLGLLNQASVTGACDPATIAAIQGFQQREATRIAQIKKDSADSRFASGKAGKGGTAGKKSNPGRIELNDATFQALAQAWPRRFGGQLLDEGQAYEFLKQAAAKKNLPLDPGRVNIIGIRGFQAGQAHNNENFGTLENRYNDTLFVTWVDDQGVPHVRESKGSTDRGPGGKTQRAMLIADQQIEYLYSPGASQFGSRPCFFMKEDGQVERKDGHVNSGRGIAIHSGGSGEQVKYSSSGCQVPHGSWYGHFISDVERALEKEDKSRVVYTILEGKDL